MLGLATVGVLTHPTAVGALLPMAMVVGAVSFGHRDLVSRAAGRPGVPVRVAAVPAIAAYSGGLSVVGLVVLTGAAAPPILAFLILSAATLWSARGQNTHGWVRVGHYPPREPPAPVLPLQTATTTQLRQWWRDSYLWLRQAPDPAGRARVAVPRGDLLAEFERRDPAGFTGFLTSGNPAARYPNRFCHDAAVITSKRLTIQP